MSSSEFEQLLLTVPVLKDEDEKQPKKKKKTGTTALGQELKKCKEAEDER